MQSLKLRPKSSQSELFYLRRWRRFLWFDFLSALELSALFSDFSSEFLDLDGFVGDMSTLFASKLVLLVVA